MLILAVDPGAKAGYAVLETAPGRGLLLATHRPELVPVDGYAEAVFEAQHSAATLFRGGRRVRIRRSSQSTLSFTAGRLFERFTAERKYRILPDDWRALLWPGSRRLPKAVVLARLRVEFGDSLLDDATADTWEAVGMAMGWQRLTQKQKEKFRVE